MQYVVSRQIAIEAETPEEAIDKTKPNEGQSISFTVNPRPQPPVVRTSMGSSSGTPQQ